MPGRTVEHEVTLWIVDDMPARMVYAGRRWVVTDVPTRLRESVWSAWPGSGRGLYGWRFQATDPDTGEAFVFDVYRAENGWHVHGLYA